MSSGLLALIVHSVSMQCILKLLAVNHTWLGLSYKEEDNEWKWEDGSRPSGL